MTIQIEEVKNKKDINDFIDVPWHLYQNDKSWIPPLRMAVEDLLKPKHPFYANGEVKNWIAKKDGKLIGRISAVYNHAHNKYHEEQRGFFGFFEAANDQELTEKLFSTAENWLKEKGAKSVLGPMNPSTNYECGTLVEGFDDPPQIMMTYNQKYHDGLIKSQGYDKAKDLLAYRLDLKNDLPELILKIADRTSKKNNITFRHVSKKNWDKEVELMLSIYNDAWEKNWGFVPMTDEEFYHTAKDLKSILDEKLIVIVEVNGEPAGFVVTLPDLHQVLKKIPSGKLFPFGVFKLLNRKKYVDRCRVITMGVKKEFRKMGLETLMYKRAHEVCRECGYKEVEMSWILEDNLNMNKPLIRMGANPYKTYRIFEKNL